MNINRGASVIVGNENVQFPASLGQIKQLQGGASTGKFDTLQFMGTQYQVPTGKKLIMFAVNISSLSGSPGECALGYADTASLDTTTVPTNPINLASFPHVSQSNTQTPVRRSIYIEVPAGKYPTVRGQTQPAHVHVIAVEVDA